jgi:xanthine dehydrogenase YagS FAD-binding subunit
MITIATTANDVTPVAGEIRAGATDVQERRRSGVSTGPMVDISRLVGYDTIERHRDGTISIGVLVKIDTVANDPGIVANYPGLAQAAGGLATPQIRWMASMGGALLQRTRCHFYRHPAYRCYKSGGQTCHARTGHNPNGVVFDLGPCVYPHPATLGMALMVYEATVTIQGHGRRPVADLYGDGTDPSRDHRLNQGELLTHIHLPAPVAGERAAYFRSISRFEAEWPVVECLARLALADGRIKLARVGVGGVANIPLQLPQVEAALLGQPATPATLANAAQWATEKANPLPQTAWKLAFLVGTVLETLERAARMMDDEG